MAEHPNDPPKITANDTSLAGRRLDSGFVRQMFSHGRSKSVQVEVKRRRGRHAQPVSESSPSEAVVGTQPESPAEYPAPKPTIKNSAPVREPRRVSVTQSTDRGLSEAELNRRREALANIKKTQEDLQKHQNDLERRSTQNAEKIKAQKEEENRQAARIAERKTIEEKKLKAEQDVAARSVRPTPPEESRSARLPSSEENPRETDRDNRDNDSDSRKLKRKERDSHRSPPRSSGRNQQERRQSKLTMAQMLQSGDEEVRMGRSLAALRRKRERERREAQSRLEKHEHVIRDVIIPDTMTVADLANRMAVQGQEVIKSLMRMGVVATLTQPIDAETAMIVVSEFGHKGRVVSASSVETAIADALNEPLTHLEARPPIISILGHVDHGKTTLLETISAQSLTPGEHGGITQHIGAFTVQRPDGTQMAFIDTPGHAAFTNMRQLGVNVTDIAILVIAADDGIQPQTIEAIAHARAAKTPLLVAITKIDRKNANKEKVKSDLVRHGVVLESLGGDVQAIEVSAPNNKGIDALLEAISLQAEIMELKADPTVTPRGVLLEAGVTRGIGATATLLLQHGTIKQGDIFVCGCEWGRVRFLRDDKGKTLKQCPPGIPVVVVGFDAPPSGGDQLVVIQGNNRENRAREIAEYRTNQKREQSFAKRRRTSLENVFADLSKESKVSLSLVVKTDVRGTLEAILAEIQKLDLPDDVEVEVLHSAVGDITESDVSLIAASHGLIVGFSTNANAKAKASARRLGVEIRHYNVIYRLLDDIRSIAYSKAAPRFTEIEIGTAEVRATFDLTKSGKVAGCLVIKGKIQRGCIAVIRRSDEEIYRGSVRQLRRFKEDVREVENNFECGIQLDGFDDFLIGDSIICFDKQEESQIPTAT